ncbi:MAG: archaeal heat shock protein Hsp20 [Candidatus Eiseniibacteriota bacterium]|jgi:HSP20 family protein
MSIEPDDWFSRFFGTGSWPFKRRGFGDMFRGFDEMRREMEREFEESFKDIETKAPKDLIREYETPEGGKVRELGPFVYGYSMTIGPDGKPRVKEFGNVKSPMRAGGFLRTPMISSEREPMSDITTTDKEVKVTIELPGVSKEDIKINAYDGTVEVTTNDPKRKYHEVVEIPPETDIETAKSSYNNGILEITFNRKSQAKPKGKEIKVE